MNSPEETMGALLSYCETNGWAGYDPYDALNGRVFDLLPFLNSRIPRLALTQLLKRSPVNFRALLGIRPHQNPKAIALFLSSFVKLSKVGSLTDPSLIGRMIERLVVLRSEGVPYWCWGYSFPWQTRTILVPRGSPNLVCTAFVADALFDAYEHTRDSSCLAMATSAARYILDELYWVDAVGAASLRYPMRTSQTPVHNANFVGAALLCRAYVHSGDKGFRDAALRVARYSASRQRGDGSWLYGESPTQNWIDNFHTGFNLCALRSIDRLLSTSEFEMNVVTGEEFYRTHFILDSGAPRYFHDRTYPIDTHCIAQTILTLVTMRDLRRDNLDLAQKVLGWALENMFSDRGYFYYRSYGIFKNKIAYVRWSEAWMTLAIAAIIETGEANNRTSSPDFGDRGRKTQIPIDSSR